LFNARRLKYAAFTAFVFIFTSINARAEVIRVGTTFSPRQSEYLEQDWKKSYLAILDMGFDVIRLAAYWNTIEKVKGVYDFKTLDWQIKEAKKRKIPVVLVVGMKAPRWPEYYIPGWLLAELELKPGQELGSDFTLGEKTLEFIKKTVDRYKNESTIRYWQVENEPLGRFGPHFWWIGKEFLEREVSLVRELDPASRPIVITAETYPNNFIRFMMRFIPPSAPISDTMQLCDILGLNIYPVVGKKFYCFNFYVRTRQLERLRYFSELITKVRGRGKKIWITELQAEPWEAGKLVHKSPEKPVSIWPDMIQATFNEMKALGVDTVFLWGAEYWHFRKTRYNDTAWLNKAKAILSE